MATEEAKFRAAVNIIRSMPKNGPFQPSAELMLRFYAYYKQASEGTCTQAKPSFWEVVNKAKWDAWKKLGNMPKEEAMSKYVEELKQIIETMSFSNNVAEFMHVLGPFYEAVYEGQEPDHLPGVRRSSSSSRTSSRSHSEADKEQLLEDESGYSSSINGTGNEENESGGGDLEIGEKEEGEGEAALPLRGSSPTNSCVSATSSSLYASTDKFYSDAESDDEYKDPLPESYQQQHYQTMNKAPHLSNGHLHSSSEQQTSAGTEQLHVTMAIQRLQADLQLINSRLETLEHYRKELMTTQKLDSGAKKVETNKRSSVDQVGSFAVTYNSLPQVVPLSVPKWFPFQNSNWATIAFVLSWPFMAQYIVARLRQRQRPL